MQTTSFDPQAVGTLAEELATAAATRTQVRQFSLRFPGMTIADAYTVQRAWVDRQVAAGRTLRGHKIGLTSRAMQQSSQVDEPDYGDLLDDMFFEPGADIPVSRFIVPRVEVELAFVLRRDLEGPSVSLFEVLEATEYVTPAIEIIDARIEQFDRDTKKPRRIVDTISDNAANAGIVLGGTPVRPHAVDLRWVSALMYKNAVIEESGVAAAVLNHPATGVAWLARKLHPYGRGLRAGQVILAGSFTRPVPAVSGDVFHVDYGPLGSIAFRFA
jgi:2-oxo-hept-3-ene-1,7-dioate hydratase